GRGKMTITKSDAAAGVWVDEMIEADEVNAHGSVTWTLEGGGTKVTWVDEGELPPVIGGYFVGMIEEMLGENFQQGLEGLKKQAETRRVLEEQAAKAEQEQQAAQEAAKADTPSRP
ncbi:MAG TPA: SRPBCC family protein, partial [Myxococcaceae bacterium]|nr:SRPBCC family protein [Myxococcaceae bacterium]